jgi:hypothetical protein
MNYTDQFLINQSINQTSIGKNKIAFSKEKLELFVFYYINGNILEHITLKNCQSKRYKKAI